MFENAHFIVFLPALKTQANFPALWLQKDIYDFCD